ncbi:MAG: hypothetical protein ACW98K_18305 [Candidatus Kariarchaeaceae archaeon]|jgi:hypothetical protein
MKNVFAIVVLCACLVGCNGSGSGSSGGDIDKIIAAKAVVRSMVNYPDTLSFHNMSTSVSGNTVTLKFTAKNAFGVPETHVMDIEVN